MLSQIAQTYRRLAYAETRWLFAFRLLEEAVGARMNHLTIERPSSWLHWQVTRLARWLTWRDLQLQRGDGSHPELS